MDTISMCATDRNHIRLFETLTDQAGVTAADLAELWCIDRSTVYRMFRGESLPTSAMMRELITRRPRTATHILEFYRRGTNCLVFEIPEDGGHEIDARLIQSLRDFADLLDDRRKHLNDGEISLDERDAEIVAIDRHLSQLHTLRAQIVDQPVSTRQKDKPLTLAKEGGS